MKTTSPRSLRTGCCLLLTAIAIAPACGLEIRDRVSPDEIRRQRQEQASALGTSATQEPDKRVQSSAGQSILGSSVILGNGHHWTLVPKGSVLHLPDALKSHILDQPSGEIMAWTQFLARNRSWLTTSEVSLETASGELPIPPAKSKSWTRGGNIVVAVHRGGAISVRQPAKPAPPSS